MEGNGDRDEVEVVDAITIGGSVETMPVYEEVCGKVAVGQALRENETVGEVQGRGRYM